MISRFFLQSTTRCREGMIYMTSTQFANISRRPFSLDIARLARYTLRDRKSFRQNFHKQQEAFKALNKKTEVHKSDSIPVRPASHLWRALGFTVIGSYIFFTLAGINEYEKSSKVKSIKEFFIDLKEISIQNEDGIRRLKFKQNKELKALPEEVKLLGAIVALNLLVTLVWKIKPAETFMWRYFTNSFASKSLCWPMLTSVFSHKHFIHLALNMYVLWSFGGASVHKFLGTDQFMAFYLSAGLISSLTSLVHKCTINSPIRALGASGAILALVIYTCMKVPDARLSVIFLPWFTFSAENAVYGIILFDLIGLCLGLRIFDHAAHLGGALFGLVYALYGEDFYRRVFRPNIFRRMKELDKNRPK